jgi:hypothetical protein
VNNISIKRSLLSALGALFSTYHLVLAVFSFGDHGSPAALVTAMVLYAVITVIVLRPWGPVVMPEWEAIFALVVSAILPVLVTVDLDPTHPQGSGYATWHIAAVGTLLTIVSARRRHAIAWIGIVVLGVQTALWAGPIALATLGVVGSAVWVGLTHMIGVAVSRAAREAGAFANAERETEAWQAAQEAHLNERQFRLRQTRRMALPMLNRIVVTGGRLAEDDQRESLLLEASIRDEIRGRGLLDDAVRQRILEARRAGTTVTLLDEGGLDNLPEPERRRVLDELAQALLGVQTDRLIIRTVPEGSDTAVTIVGLRSVSEDAAALGALDEDAEDEVDLWLEIPRRS